MKKFIVLAVAAALSSGISAQNLKVSDFHHDPADISAAAQRVDDLNGEPCGLIKVSLSVDNPTFEGDVLKTVPKGKSEYWVYVVDGASYLNIKTDDYPVLRYDFPESARGNQTYIMDVIRPGENPARRTLTLRFDDGTGEEATYKLDMVLCKAGRFEMGDTQEQYAHESDATPHWVRISRDYYISETEVTQDLWEFVMGLDANQSIVRGPKFPVDNISYQQAEQFITSLNKMVSVGVFRLPTEAEWEYAARGAHKMTRTRFAGGDRLDDVAWHYGNSPNGTHKVKTKAPNEIGVYDMSGNVWELCSDWKEDYKDKELTDPKGPDRGRSRVRRGGAYDSKDPLQLRVAYRRRSVPNEQQPSVGLRLVWQR